MLRPASLCCLCPIFTCYIVFLWIWIPVLLDTIKIPSVYESLIDYTLETRNFSAHRTGICGARNAGDCVKIHDPSKIAVCPSWLLGQCRKSNCPLQHKRQEDLMPTCIHFLRVSPGTLLGTNNSYFGNSFPLQAHTLSKLCLKASYYYKWNILLLNLMSLHTDFNVCRWFSHVLAQYWHLWGNFEQKASLKSCVQFHKESRINFHNQLMVFVPKWM